MNRWRGSYLVGEGGEEVNSDVIWNAEKRIHVRKGWRQREDRRLRPFTSSLRFPVSDLVAVGHAVGARAEGADPLGRKGALLLGLGGQGRETYGHQFVKLPGAGAVSLR